MILLGVVKNIGYAYMYNGSLDSSINNVAVVYLFEINATFTSTTEYVLSLRV